MKSHQIHKFTFPLAILAIGLLCGLVMWKFGSPVAKTKNPAPVAKAPVVQKEIPPPNAQPAPVQPAPVVAPEPVPTKVIEKKLEPVPEQKIVVVQTPKVQLKPKAVKRVVTKKVIRKKARVLASWGRPDLKRIERAQTIIVDEVSDALLEVDETAGVDLVSPLNDLATAGLNSSEIEFTYNPESRLSLVQLDESVLSGGYAREQRLTVVEGEMVQNTFDEYKAEITALSEEVLPELEAPEAKVDLTTQAALEEIPAESEEKEPKENLDTPLLASASNVLSPVITEGTSNPEVVSPSHSTSESPRLEPPQDTSPPVSVSDAEPIFVEPNREAVVPKGNLEVVIPEKAAESKSETTTQENKSSTSVIVGSLAPKAPVISQTRVATLVKPNPQPEPPINPPTPPSIPDEKDESNISNGRGVYGSKENDTVDSTPNDTGKFNGRIYVDAPLKAWLDTKRAHFELYLHRENSKDPQDTRFIEYEYGAPDFEFEGEGLQGKYRLVAAFYTGTGATPVGQIQYPKAISAGDYKKTIVLDLKKADLDKSIATEANPASKHSTVINLTVFRGAPGNYRQSTAISGANVQVIGFPEWGNFKSDAEGNVRIPNVSRRSEYLLDVSAQGYYPTRQIVPVFDNNAYSAVYLIAKEDVYSVTHFFTKNEQAAGKSVVMGRVYDSKTRVPAKDEEVSLSFRKGRAVYFNALPDLNLRSTSDTGLFGFYNVEPSFRSLQRASGKHASLFNLLPEYGIYYEFGRGGEKALKGRFFDPFRNVGVSSKFHIVGDENNEDVTNENGFFKISRLDLPPGVLTLEIRNDDFPTTWQTIPWNSREPERVKNFFMVDKEVVDESRKINRVQTVKGTGTVIGGAENSFFQKGRACVRVELQTHQGHKVDAAMGPYPLSGAKVPSKGFCLTQAAPGFSFFNVPSGEYVLKWMDKSNRSFRSRILRVGMDRVSVVVN